MPAVVVLQLLVLHVLLTIPHEVGHFLVARRLGIAVPEFGIGLPPTVLAARWRGTRWTLNLLPLGAFVAYEIPRARGAGRRTAILFAGPLANLGVALLCVALICLDDSGSLADLARRASRHLEGGGGTTLIDKVVPLFSLTRPAIGAYVRRWTGYREFLRLLLSGSVAVGLFNLLPLPTSDGSKLLAVALDVLGRGPAVERWIGRLSLAAVVGLACAGAVATLAAGS